MSLPTRTSIGGEPPPRHPKRWQDVEELLDAGINVWTTVNVQHLESLNDLVAQITGVRQRETLPDRIFDEADEVELIDLPPDDLLARLHAGKVYVPERYATAVDRFFRKSNLIALRELALAPHGRPRRGGCARLARAGPCTRARLARDRVLVALGPDPQAEQLVRAGKRMADALDAEWTVVYVETPELLRLSERQRNRRIDLLRLAESLGAETVTLDRPDRCGRAARVCADAPRDARDRRRAQAHGWRALLRPSAATELMQARARLRCRHRRAFRAPRSRQTDRLFEPRMCGSPCAGAAIAWALAITGVCTLVAFVHVPVFRALEPRDGVSAGRHGRRAAAGSRARRCSRPF